MKLIDNLPDFFYTLPMRKIICLALLLLLSGSALAHPGKTDTQGGHKCWKNCDEWELVFSEYHLHDKDGNPVRLDAKGNPVHPLPSGETPAPPEVQASPKMSMEQTPATVPGEEERPGEKIKDRTVIEQSYSVIIPEESVLPLQTILLIALAALLLVTLVFVRRKRDRD